MATLHVITGTREHVTVHETPMDALEALAHDVKVDSEFTMTQAACYIDGVLQWKLTIDENATHIWR